MHDMKSKFISTLNTRLTSLIAEALACVVQQIISYALTFRVRMVAGYA
jgi:hypothetical protein